MTTPTLAACADLQVDYLRLCPGLADVLEKHNLEWVLSAAERLRESCPVAVATAQNGTGAFRIPGHERSFCFNMSGPLSRGIADPVAVIKGSEPACPNVQRALRSLANMPAPPWSTQDTMFEHFALYEGKIPGAVTIREALAEASMACEIQLAYLDTYSDLGRFPIPLFVYALSSQHIGALRDAIRPLATDRSWTCLEPRIAQGLGVFVYLSHATPLRVAQVDRMVSAGDSYADRLARLTLVVGNPATVIDRWAQSFVRLVLMGYFPADLGSQGLGECCNYQNATIDGGFADLESVTRMKTSVDSERFGPALDRSFGILCETVLRFLVGKRLTQRLDDRRRLRFVRAMIQRHLSLSSLKALDADATHDRLNVASRIRSYLCGTCEYDVLHDALATVCA